MGLDIYLYRYDKPRAQVEAENEAWESVTSGIWQEYEKEHGKSDKWPEGVNKKWRADVKKAAKKEGRVGDWDNHPCEVKIEEDSKNYPKHLFKIGYFRSSYNDGGINRVLKDRIGQDLYSILGLKDQEYEQQPNWKAVIKRVDSAMEQYEALLKDNPFTMLQVSHNIFHGMPEIDTEKALAMAAEELITKKHPSTFESYSNRDGFYCPKGLKIYGAINGKDCLGAPCVYLVTKDDGGENGLRWYLHALEIIKETAEWVLAQKDQSKYWLHVSG